jgi:hypothetical protein
MLALDQCVLFILLEWLMGLRTRSPFAEPVAVKCGKGVIVVDAANLPAVMQLATKMGPRLTIIKLMNILHGVGGRHDGIIPKACRCYLPVTCALQNGLALM